MHELLSGEAVAIDVQPVGVVMRALGSLIDVLVSMLVAIAFMLLGAMLATAGLLGEAASHIFTIVMIVTSLVILPCTVELATRGRSLGRLAVGGRIVRVDGGATGLRHAFIRALVGVFEIYMTLGAVAILSGVFSPRSQRLGDLLSGSYCQRVRTRPLVSRPAYLPPELAQWATVADVAKLPDRLARRIAQFLAQAPQLSAPSRFRVAAELLAEAAPYVAPLPSIPMPSIAGPAHGEARPPGGAPAAPGLIGAPGAPGAPAVRAASGAAISPDEIALQAILAVRRERETRALRLADERVARLTRGRPPADTSTLIPSSASGT